MSAGSAFATTNLLPNGGGRGGRAAGKGWGRIKRVDAWRAFRGVSYPAPRAGDTISVRVVQPSRAVAGDSFQVDALSLTAPSDDGSPPAAPTGFTAQAASQ